MASFSVATAMLGAAMVPILAGLERMPEVNSAQVPGSCELVQVTETLDSFQCYSAAIALHDDDGKPVQRKGLQVYTAQPLPIGMLKDASENRRGIPAGGVES